MDAVGNTYTLDIPDLGPFQQQRFNLGGGDILTAPDNDVLDPAYHTKIATVIEGSQVAGVEPAIGIQHFAVSSGLL